MLRKLRITLSLIFFALISFFLLDFAELLPTHFHILEMIQFVPALLALHWLIIITLIILTLFFGRIYCSSVCPLGVYQDFISRLRKTFSSKKHRKKYKYRKALTLLRWTFAGISLLSFISGFSFLVGLLDPYSIFSRFTIHILKPAYLAGNNLLAVIFSHYGNHTFYQMAVYVMSVSSLIIALTTILIVSIMAWKNGRIYCNTVCPVGTTLGVFSRFSLFQIRFDSEKCNLCGSCARNCKASCIDFKNNTVDASRCINCFNCIDSCKESGLKYRLPFSARKLKPKSPDSELNLSLQTPGKKLKPEPKNSRRQFLGTMGLTMMATGTLLADSVILPGKKKEVQKKQPIMPPGAASLDKFSTQCTSCHLCIAKCPAQVIRPAFLEYGIAGMMQPMLDYQDKFCNYECTVCSEVCPTGALIHLSKEEKTLTQFGVVQLYIHNCIVYTDETNCGACSEHCPTQAVSMVPYKGSLTMPKIDQSICVGCGGCESICPAKPHKAIFVEGVEAQSKITLVKEAVKEVEVDDFGF